MVHSIKSFLGLISVLCIVSCSESYSDNQDSNEVAFRSIPSSSSGLEFSNILDENLLKNPWNYINAYTGGGVSIGDINNDGLQDIFLASNMSTSKLFLNKGDMKFEDITLTSGTSTEGWCSAVTMADVNQDGWLDIYVCRSYHDEPALRTNLLFINNKNGSFTEAAEEWGINDENYSTASSFFDYDLDGDLDLIVGNHPRFRFVSLQTHYDYWLNPVLRFSNRLYRNDGNSFNDVTESSGILSYGFTLAVSTSDYNVDGFPDITLTVDHDEPDIFFKNNGDGTFTNEVGVVTNQISLSSMGIDAGDINHDPYPDLFVAEMLSEDHYREKVSMGMQTVNRFNFLVDTMKYKYYQMHNFLYLNNGNGTFSDISQLAGVSKSDWSWASLFFDFDNDSWQDLFVCNGWYREIYNKDRRKQFDKTMTELGGNMKVKNKLAKEFAKNAPQQKIANYLFKNTGKLSFEKYTKNAGLNEKTISTGGAYADLDNDGDLDLVLNNLGEESLLYQNTNSSNNKYLRIGFKTNGKTPLGSKVYLHVGDDFQSRELLTTRGFLSSSEPFVHFGLGEVDIIDKVEVVWPDGKMQTFHQIKTNSIINVEYKDADKKWHPPIPENRFATPITASESGLTYEQNDNNYNDYADQVLLPHKMSESGPFITKADINNDGLEDIYFGSPHGQSGALFKQLNDGTFTQVYIPDFEKDRFHEDGHSVFFDADSDGDLDLAVTSTGYEFDMGDPLYQPRLYLNNGSGDFKKANGAFPDFFHPTSCIEVIDINKDGYKDLFLGGHQNPKNYPLAGTSAIFRNNGNGTFTESIDGFCPDLKQFGMIKDALWTDINGDGDSDLIAIGEWTPISFWIQENGKLINQTKEYFTNPVTGWWNCIEESDLDNNGLNDYVIGNLGKNYKYKASEDKPFIIYGSDFDGNGTQDIVLGTYYGEVIYPVRGRSCSTEQIPDMKDKFPTFEEYALSDIKTVYGDGLEEAIKYEVNQFASIILYQNEKGKFTVEELPELAQVSPINGIIIKDINNDKLLDLIVAGNLYQSEIETGRADSGTGRILLNQGQQKFKALPVHKSGLYLPKDVKSIKYIELGESKQGAIVVGNNQEKCELIKLNHYVE